MALRAIRYLVLVSLLLFSLIVIGLNAHIITLPSSHSPSKRAIEPVPIELPGIDPLPFKPPADTPSTDTPSTDTPSTDTPSTDTPSTDTPSTDAPSTGQSGEDSSPTTPKPSGQKPGKPPSSINWKEASKTYEDLGLGVASLTVITVGTILFFDRRSGCSCPAIHHEIAFMGTLWALWTATFIIGITRSCGLSTAPYYADYLSCPLAETKGAFAATAVIWVLLLAYAPTLYISARLASKGNIGIWDDRVRDADFTRKPVGEGRGDHEALTRSG